MDRSGDAAAARPHCRNSSLFCRPFRLGTLASIGIHGWGTEYTVGWESTWLSDKPSAVLTFINLFYGMIPVNSDLFNQLTPQVIESMNFGSGHGQNAAPWLLQLFYIISLVVVVPRILLGLYALAKTQYIENHFPLILSRFITLIFSVNGEDKLC